MSYGPPIELVEALKNSSRVALITHVNPDGDGLGSEAALAEALESIGKAVFIANADPTPARYEFLKLSRWGAPNGDIDLAVTLDTSAPDRIGKAMDVHKAAKRSLVIDHHAGGAPFAQFNWVLADAPSTGSMIAPLIKALGARLTPGIAGAIYTALAYDTGCFKHSNTDAGAFELAGTLKAAGADTAEINRLLFDSRPPAAVKLVARALGAVELGHGGQSALTLVSQAMMKDCGAGPEDSDGLVEAGRSIDGVEVSAFLREEGPAKVKLSLRSKRWLDVNAFAAQFGGGGHHRASGATLNMGLEEAIAKVSEALTKALEAKAS